MSAERRQSGRPTDEAAAAELAAYPVSRFTARDVGWTQWLTERMKRDWPEFRPESWPSRLAQLSQMNDALFIKNDRAILLITATPRLIDGKEILIESFGWSRDAVPNKLRGGRMMITAHDPAERPLILLYRHAREWARSRRAARMFIGQNSDITQLRLQELMNGRDCGWVSVKL